MAYLLGQRPLYGVLAMQGKTRGRANAAKGDLDLARLASIVESSDDAIISKTLDGTILTWNAGAERTFGYTAKEAIGRSITLLLPPGAEDEETRILAKIRKGERIQHYETLRRRKDGSIINVTVSVSPIRDASGRIVAASKIARDITEQTRAKEQELERLKELNRLKTQFINTAAHELLTPLTPIWSVLHVMSNDPKHSKDPVFRKNAAILSRNLDRLKRLVQDILDSSRLEAQKLGVKKREVDVRRLVEPVVESFQAEAEKADIRLTTKLDDVGTVQADPERFSQVLYNLLSNALKFTPPKGSVTVEAEHGGQGTTFRVRDDGIGIDPGMIGRLFQPFSRAPHDLVESQPGTGLGLYITKGIVELHGGQIRCESAGPGKGATFVVVLPP